MCIKCMSSPKSNNIKKIFKDMRLFWKEIVELKVFSHL